MPDQTSLNPRLPKGGGYELTTPSPLRFIFRPAKTRNSTIKRMQLILGSSFPVILMHFFNFPTLGQRQGKLSKLGVEGCGCHLEILAFTLSFNTKILLLCVLETSCVRQFLSKLAENPIKITYSQDFGQKFEILPIFIQNPYNLFFYSDVIKTSL